MARPRKHSFEAGHRFARLTVVVPVHKKGMWLCRCDCGNTVLVGGSVIASGGQQSCGCYRDEQTSFRGAQRKKHGMHKSAEYKSWTQMKSRCLDEKHHAWDDYGGRGIKVCSAWLEFENFYADMGPRPIDTSLDRINNNGDYEPGNCRWATDVEQKNNTRSNRLVNMDGITKTMTQWCREKGIKTSTVYSRLSKGWPIEKLFIKPSNQGN